jgi:plasmid stability protein
MPSVRTTIRIDDDLYRRAKARAAQTGRTVGELIEDAVRAALRPQGRRDGELPTLPVYGGSGVQPGVDLTSNVAIRDAMDEAADVDAMR